MAPDMDKRFPTPKGAQVAAQRSIDKSKEKPPSQRGMTPWGRKYRRAPLARGEWFTLRQYRRFARYFSRHLEDKQGQTWDDYGKGRQAWDGWGDDVMARHVIRTIRKHDKQWFTKWAESPRNRRLMRHLGL